MDIAKKCEGCGREFCPSFFLDTHCPACHEKLEKAKEKNKMDRNAAALDLLEKTADALTMSTVRQDKLAGEIREFLRNK